MINSQHESLKAIKAKKLHLDSNRDKATLKRKLEKGKKN